MTTSRIKAPVVESRAEFERVIDDLARTTVDVRKLTAARDQRLQAVRADWDPQIKELNSRIASLAVIAEKYASEHRDELLPSKLKSAETALAIFGFRTGMPSLKLLSKWTWEKVVEALSQFKMEHCLRAKLEVDREAILRNAEDGAVDGRPLSDIGVKIVQTETFYIEPKEKPAEAAVA